MKRLPVKLMRNSMFIRRFDVGVLENIFHTMHARSASESSHFPINLEARSANDVPISKIRIDTIFGRLASIFYPSYTRMILPIHERSKEIYITPFSKINGRMVNNE